MSPVPFLPSRSPPLFMVGDSGGCLEKLAGGDEEKEQTDADTQKSIDKKGRSGGWIGDKGSQEDDEEIAKSACKEPKTGDDAFEVFAGSGVGIFETGCTDENFGKGENKVRNALPEDGELVAGIEEELDSGDTGVGETGEDDSAAHAAQRRRPTTDARVDEQSDDGYRDHDDERIHALHFFGAEGEVHCGRIGENEGLHLFALEHPAGHRLVKEAPEGDDS